jgi:uncharacterized protein
MPSEPLDAAVPDHGAPPPPLPSPERIQELLFDAARLGRTDVIPALIQAGGDVMAFDAKGHPPLTLSCYHGHEAAAVMLLDHSAPVDQGDTARGNTALMGVAFKGFTSIADRLLEAGAEVDAVNQAGQTALMFAALFGRADIVDRLVARGAEPNRTDAAGNSAISMALSQGNEALAAHLSALSSARA